MLDMRTRSKIRDDKVYVHVAAAADGGPVDEGMLATDGLQPGTRAAAQPLRDQAQGRVCVLARRKSYQIYSSHEGLSMQSIWRSPW